MMGVVVILEIRRAAIILWIRAVVLLRMSCSAVIPLGMMRVVVLLLYTRAVVMLWIMRVVVL